MPSLNKVFLMGNLTRDPELRYIASGSAVTTLGVALNRFYMTKEGERREDVTFVDVTVWNRAAENCCQYLKKGQPVHIEGYLKLDTWDDKNSGEKRSKLSIEAERVQFLNSRRDDGGGGNAPDDDYAPAASRESRPQASAPRGNPNGPSRGSDGPNAGAAARRPSPPSEQDEDDIPF
jgi:single-strand DNA-binding protein